MTEPGMNRKTFLKQCGLSAAAATCSLGLAAVFHNRRPVPEPEEAVSVGSFLVPGTERLMAVVQGTDHSVLVRAAVEAIGGIKRFVNPGDRVLLKPNCAFDRPPHLGATTSPAVMGALTALCVEAGARVRVTDNPINDPEGCFIKSGLTEAVNRNGGDIWLPSPGLFRTTRTGTLCMTEWEALYEPLAWATRVIGVPTVKTHNLCGATLGLKNWYGLLGGPRNRLHQSIHEAIADLGQFIRPTLTVLDGTRLLIRNGPTGGSPSDVMPGHTVIVGTDPVAVDAWGATLLGLSPGDLAYIGLAESIGLGRADPDQLSLFRRIEAGS